MSVSNINNQNSCPICLESMPESQNEESRVQALACSHIFHTNCLTMWLTQHNSCPVCRHPVTDLNNGEESAANAQEFSPMSEEELDDFILRDLEEQGQEIWSRLAPRINDINPRILRDYGPLPDPSRMSDEVFDNFMSDLEEVGVALTAAGLEHEERMHRLTAFENIRVVLDNELREIQEHSHIRQAIFESMRIVRDNELREIQERMHSRQPECEDSRYDLRNLLTLLLQHLHRIFSSLTGG